MTTQKWHKPEAPKDGWRGCAGAAQEEPAELCAASRGRAVSGGGGAWRRQVREKINWGKAKSKKKTFLFKEATLNPKPWVNVVTSGEKMPPLTTLAIKLLELKKKMI